jgi:hypothetical protein
LVVVGVTSIRRRGRELCPRRHVRTVRERTSFDVETMPVVELLGRYRNQDIVDRLERILAGAGRDRPSARPVRSLRRQKRLNSDEVRELVAARVSGAEISELAGRFGIDRNTVMTHLKREGVPGRRWPGRTLSDEQLEEAGRLYESGLRLDLVADRFNVRRHYLRDALAQAGFTIRRAGQQRRQS